MANAGDNPAPAISGAEGGGLAVHGDYSIAAYPTFILIDPEWNIVEQDIWPMSVDILDDVLAVLWTRSKWPVSPLSIARCRRRFSVEAWPNPAHDALQVEADAREPSLTLLDLLGREVHRAHRRCTTAPPWI